MNLPALAVRRPVLTAMVTLAVVLVGLVSLGRLQIDLLPSIEMASMTVRTSFAGASPEVMEQTVTRTIEEIVATVPGVEEIASTSSEGDSRVRVTFGWGTDLDAAASDVRATLEDELNELPDDITRPRVRKFDVDSFPVVILGVSSEVDPVELTQRAENEVRYRVGRVPGVAQVDLWGGYNREIRVEVDPERVKAQGLGFDQVVQAIRDANLDQPAGQIEQGRYEVTLRAPAQFQSVEDIRDTVLVKADGAAVTLGQIAAVKDTHERLTEIERVNGVRGIRVAVRKQPSANTVEVARGVLEAAEQISADFPQLDVVPIINQGNFIERSIANVARSVLYGGVLAVLVLLLFLRNLRSTVVIALSIPISVIATFALVYIGGLTLNLMTLGGLALGVGMMVDSSIVVLENIFRRQGEEGLAPAVAAVEGAREVGPAIVASTLTTLVIFLPLVFVRGVTGLLFQELALVIVFALLCSLLVSLSVVPVLAAQLLKRERQAPPPGLLSRAAELAESALSRLDAAYRELLLGALARRWTTVLGAAGLFAASLLLLPLIGSEFMPPSDEGEVRINGEMEPGTRLDIVERQTRIVESIVFPAVPELAASVVSVEDGEGSIRMSLVPAAQRSRSNTEIADDLRQRLEGQVPGMDIRVRAPQGQFLLERVLGNSEDGLTVEIRGFELDTLDLLAERAAERIEAVDGITDVRLSRREGVPQQELRVDRAKVADLGLRVRDVSALLETAMAGRDAGEFRADGDSFRIFVQLADAPHRSLDEILELTLTTASGRQVALRNVVVPVKSDAPLEIQRKDQQRLITLGANVAGRDLGSTAAEVQAILNGLARPEGYELTVSGAFEEQQRAFDELLASLLLAIALVYMVLAAQYESLRRPLVVMLSVPVAAVGVLLTLVLTATTFNLQSTIGCIMLGGIVVNNAILLVDQAGQLQDEGSAVDAALLEAGRRRLRPILMTTTTTILGLMPLALGIGEGADAQAPLARAVVGGLVGSTAISLLLIPAVYALMNAEDAPQPE